MGCSSGKLAATSENDKGNASQAFDANQEATTVKPLIEAPILACVRRHAEAGVGKAVLESGLEPSMTNEVSYAQLLSNVEEVSKIIASTLASRPQALPAHVAYLISPGIAYVVIELAVWRCGGLCVPLSMHSPAPELEYFLQDSEAALAIADGPSEAKLRPIADKLGRVFASISAAGAAGEAPGVVPPHFVLSAGAAPEVGVAAARAQEEVDVALASPALILYTSGTTGKPKGVVHTFQSLTAQMQSLSEAWKWSSKDHTLHVLPLHHIHGVQNILNTALWSGAAVEFTTFNPAHCLNRLSSGDITCFHAVPTIYTKFTQHLNSADDQYRADVCQGLRNSSLRYMVSGSAALPIPTMQSWAEISGHVLLERYGMTEIGMSLSNRIDDTRYPGCVGFPLPRVEVKLDEDGGILVKGATVFKEYYKREEATSKDFTEDGWFRTGDNAQVGGSSEELQQLQDHAREVDAATGRPRPETVSIPSPDLAKIYKIMGRSSVDIIKSGGYKISGLEIESVLLQHQRIKECAVVGVPDETWGEKVTAVCVLQGGDLTLSELREWGKSRLATYKVPAGLVAVQELPRNQMGKLEKKKLLDRLKAEVDGAGAAPEAAPAAAVGGPTPAGGQEEPIAEARKTPFWACCAPPRDAAAPEQL